ncbi:porin family protein [Aureisphaera galaxeae]|uniref:porin family protein n=1 Tax=Aureisphaera galaxeae TaxID=1538023 RepID=UPI00235009FA|nr:porin family protein [Aureisphaera galaxeae]MDC8004283.1 porin family protein [Aureisphaera galaxeae]
MKCLTHILIICTLLIVTPLSAQEDTSSGSFFSGWEFGAKAGINLSNMYGDVGDNSFLFFANAGAVIDKKVIDPWSLSVEPHVSGEGQNLNEGYERVIYLNLPFLVKYQVAEPLSIDGGIHMGVKIAERTKFSNGDTKNRNRFKRIAPGFTAGVTYDVTQDWFVQFRTNLKLSDVIRYDAGDTEGSTILAFQFSVGRWFN